MNCWEKKNCGRQVGGPKAGELGVCPAAKVAGGGQACWLISETMCGGVIQGDAQTKLPRCLSCDVYSSYDLKHRTEMRKRFLGAAPAAR